MISSATITLTDEEAENINDSIKELKEKYETDEQFKRFIDEWNSIDSAPHTTLSLKLFDK